MGRHSIADADERWISLLEQMNDKIPLARYGQHAVPATILLSREWWENAHYRPKSHARPSTRDRLVAAVVVWVWVTVGYLIDAADAFVAPRFICRTSARIHSSRDTLRRVRIAQRRSEPLPTTSADAALGGVVRHVAVLSLVVALVQMPVPSPPTPEVRHVLVRPG